MIWKQKIDLDALNALGRNSMPGYLEIEFIEIGNDFLVAKMPVNEKTKQPFGILHGGASVVLAESMGSVASTVCIEDITKQHAVGVEINANHLKSVKNGYVFGKVKPIRIGNKLHVWNIEISNENKDLVCTSRLTCMIVEAR